MLLLVKASQVPAGDVPVRILTTVFGVLVLVLLLSGLNATVFDGAPEKSWRKRLPTIFLDVARFALIGVGLALMLSYVWGVRVGGLFTALGVTSVVIGLMLQNSVGQVVSGLFMLFEQPFRIDDWLDTGTARGRVVEVNWRAVHIDTGSGMRIMPNSMLATTSFTNLSRPPGAHKLPITTTFSSRRPARPGVRDALASCPRVAAAQARQRAPLGTGRGGRVPHVGRAELTRRRRRGEGDISALGLVRRPAGELHLDDADDDFSTTRSGGARSAHRGGSGVAAEPRRISGRCTRARGSSDTVPMKSWSTPVEVPPGMTFLIAGRVQLTATAEDGTVVPVTTLVEGSFLGLTTLTRQPNLASAYALEEVTALEIDREHLEQMVMHEPLLLQDFGRTLEERRSKVRRARAVSGSGEVPARSRS